MNLNCYQRKGATMQRRDGARHLCRFSAVIEQGVKILTRAEVSTLKRPESRAPLIFCVSAF